ncbi:MAG: MarR family transcriptional regulator [Actinobacteria bacterium]|uniref:MarR family transcriptional regulator n=1 Tax=Candidatus Fonsibacter lacus TaxID=2576439 RepID=A0A965LL64_9PROT|nr:MarR family transcriptional regulator [Candidatus Fonsibacter lacus]
MNDNRDEVNALVDAWRRERPDLDVAPLEVLSRITRLARQLDIARRAAFTKHGLETWGFDVLAALRRAGAPYQLTPGELIHENLVTSGTITNRLDRLENDGLLSRHSDPSDGRSTLVRITSKGIEVVDGALGDLLHREKELLQSLKKSEREELAGYLSRMLTQFESEAPVKSDNLQ